MNYLDLFSGIGGFHLGLSQAGFEFEWTGYSEINTYAKKVYAKHFPQSQGVQGTQCQSLGDIRAIDPLSLPRIDIVSFGFPCQDISIAGKRRGLSASRSGLFFEAIRIIDATKPRLFIFENVKGLFSSNDGRDFQTVLQTIADVGYDGVWQLLNTAWFLPQNRERIYFVGFPRSQRPPQVFPLCERSFIPDGAAQEKSSGQSTLCSTIGTRYGALQCSGETYITKAAQSQGTQCQAAQRQDTPWKATQKLRQGYRVRSVYGLADTLQSNAGALGGKTGLYDVSPCLRSNHRNTADVHFILDPSKTPVNIRRLTPLECERLQGFPEGWTEGISDTQRYVCLGNAVSVPVVKAIGEKLKPSVMI